MFCILCVLILERLIFSIFKIFLQLNGEYNQPNDIHQCPTLYLTTTDQHGVGLNKREGKRGKRERRRGREPVFTGGSKEGAQDGECLYIYRYRLYQYRLYSPILASMGLEPAICTHKPTWDSMEYRKLRLSSRAQMRRTPLRAVSSRPYWLDSTWQITAQPLRSPKV